MEVLVTSPWVPREWIEAHGLKPRGVWLRPHPQPLPVPEGVCAFAQEVAGLAEENPEAALVLTTACDQMRRTADAMAFTAAPRSFLFNLPATWQSSAARRLYRAELARLGKHLETLGGRAPTPEELAGVIHEHEARRVALRGLVRASSARHAAEALTNWFSGAASPPAPSAAAPQGVRLALVGGPLPSSHWRLFDAIGAAGGCVVVNATEPGERCLLPPLPPLIPSQHPLTALADHYFDHMIDVFNRPNSRLYDWLRPRIGERRVQGIVLWHYVGCDLWRAEVQPLREAFGLPVLPLDAGEPTLQRNAGRLEAFLESLQ